MHQGKPQHEPCQCGCGHIATERNRYFTGKFLTERDFAAEQEYFLSRHRLHNRLLHGSGIVCGLRVLPHRDNECALRWVVVEGGIAIDCCGRELVLCQPTPYELQLAMTKGEASGAEEEEPPYRGEFLICLQYVEEEVEYVPALYAEGTCDPTRRQANRVRETAKLVTRRPNELPGECWRQTGGDPKARCRDDCDQALPGPKGTCLEPVCPCNDVIPLALIRPARGPDGEDASFDHGFEIDLDGRRELQCPADYLTHIVHINWPHGGDVKLSDLTAQEGMNRELRVRFDRKLQQPQPPDDQCTGVSAHTFIVQYGGAQRDLEFLPSETDPELRDDCVAVFTIDPDVMGRRGNIAGNVVYVTLRCDFILDCHGNPVDGNHLRGRLPSGDGVAGGVFESWFRVVYDEEVD
jgi:hypothetical protein